MSDDALDHPRIRELLLQAEDVRASLGEGDAILREALDDVHRELGRQFHLWAHAAQPELFVVESPAAEELADLPELPDYTGEDDLTEIPDPEDLLAYRRELEGPAGESLSLDTIAERMEALGSVENDLGELLDLLRPPRDLVDPRVMPDEASKVQWASGELAGRLADSPSCVQAAVLGMLAARARNVAEHLDVDIGPRMAIDRLRRYRDQQDLPSVAGLSPNARPERASWADDARAFWEMLRPR